MRTKAREMGNVLNSYKAQIDRCMHEQKVQNTNEETGIKDIKGRYRAVWEEFNGTKEKIRLMEVAYEASRKTLLSNFYAWFVGQELGPKAPLEGRRYHLAPSTSQDEDGEDYSCAFFSAKAKVMESASLAEKRHRAKSKMIAFGSKFVQQ